MTRLNNQTCNFKSQRQTWKFPTQAQRIEKLDSMTTVHLPLRGLESRIWTFHWVVLLISRLKQLNLFFSLNHRSNKIVLGKIMSTEEIN